MVYDKKRKTKQNKSLFKLNICIFFYELDEKENI